MIFEHIILIHIKVSFQSQMSLVVSLLVQFHGIFCIYPIVKLVLCPDNLLLKTNFEMAGDTELLGYTWNEIVVSS